MRCYFSFMPKLYDYSIFPVNIDQLEKTQLELETLESKNTELLQEITMLRKANGKFVHSKYFLCENRLFWGKPFSIKCLCSYIYSLFGCFVLKLRLTFALPVYLIHWQNC